MKTSDQQFTAILLMAVATYATRAGGLLIMQALGSGPRLETLLRSLSGSALAALAAGTAVHGDAAMEIGVLAALAVVLRYGNILLGLLASVAVTTLFRTILIN